MKLLLMEDRMIERTASMKSFMAERLPIERWRVYVIRFIFFLSAATAVTAASELPQGRLLRAILLGIGFALVMSGAFWWFELRMANDKI
jgi:uncharacterized membrane protein